VFIIGKDFAHSMQLQSGIASGMTPEIFDPAGHRSSGAIRHYSNTGTSGVIPKTRINYQEIAGIAGGSITKDQCRTHSEAVFKKYSDQVRRCHPVEFTIPHVGRLSIKNRLAGVVFEQGLLEQAKGSTGKNFQGLFMKNNWMNNKLYEPNTGSYGEQAYFVDGCQSTKNLRVSSDAQQWLKNNLDIEYGDLYFKQKTGKQTRPSTAWRDSLVSRQHSLSRAAKMA